MRVPLETIAKSPKGQSLNKSFPVRNWSFKFFNSFLKWSLTKTPAFRTPTVANSTASSCNTSSKKSSSRKRRTFHQPPNKNQSPSNPKNRPLKRKNHLSVIKNVKKPTWWPSPSAHTSTESITPRTCAPLAIESMGETKTLSTALILIDCFTPWACAKPATSQITTREEPRLKERQCNLKLNKWRKKPRRSARMLLARVSHQSRWIRSTKIFKMIQRTLFATVPKNPHNLKLKF